MARLGRLAGLALGLLVAACSSPTPPPRPMPAPVRRVIPVAPVIAPKPQKPTWVARKVVADAVEIPASTVVVAPGDSLAAIASRAAVGTGALAAANGIVPPYALTPGQALQVPAGRYHRVKEGETGIAIARAYGVAWDTIITANRLMPPYAIRVGDRLKLPSKRAVAAMSMEERARAFRLDIGDIITGSEPAAPAKPVKPRVRPAAPTTAANPPAQKPLVEPATFAGRFAWPITGRILSAFGPKPGGRYNDGVNIAATEGASVKAAADGVVAYAGNGIEGFGGLVLIKHGEGWVTAYAHNSALLVARGDRVTRGQTIANAGSTGSVDEPQVHFEIRRGRTAVDPLKALPAR